MKKIFMAAVAAFFALMGAVTQAEDQTVALATPANATPSVEAVEATRQALLASDWLIIIYQFPTASKSLRGLATFSMENGKLIATVIDRNTPTTMEVEIGDGTVILTSTTGSKIHLKPKDGGFEGVSITSSGKEYQVSAQKA